jgi:4-amino-4-deoxy-L-arabinose transferase-like glycosyltransferase
MPLAATRLHAVREANAVTHSDTRQTDQACGDISRIRSRLAGLGFSPPDLFSVVLAAAFIFRFVAYLWTDLTYDEAVYLRLARTIAESGLPLRRSYEAFDKFQLFENSPPLVLYLVSFSQRFFPGEEVPARLLNFIAFVLPTCGLVWWVARTRFGPWAAVASLTVLLTNAGFVRATSHVLLNVPLGLLACLGLVAFHEASSSVAHRRTNSLIAAMAMLLAVWTKYQAVCLAGAIVLYAGYALANRGYGGLRPMLRPLMLAVVSAGVGVVALFWYYWAFGGPGTIEGTFTSNVRRASPSSMSVLDIGGALAATARETESRVGGLVLLLGAFSACVENRHRGLVVGLASYCALTIAFNLALFRLPGAGAAYLDSAVGALALLAGPAAIEIGRRAETAGTRLLLAIAAIGIHVAGATPSLFELPRANASRVAAAYIAAVSSPAAGVLAETVAIEFYCGHPVRAVSFTYPKELILRSLDGSSGDITFVVVDSRTVPKNLELIRDGWDRLLLQHFELVPVGAPGLHVYRRRRLKTTVLPARYDCPAQLGSCGQTHQ